MKKVEALSLEELQKERKIEWIDMGIEGLTDFILGLPKGDAILVRGEPSTGKTILCLQFIHRGAEKGEKCVYISTEETPQTIMRTGRELWSDFPSMIQNKQVAIVDLSIGASYASDYALINKEEAVDILMKGLDAQPDATRIVMDSLSSLERRLVDPTDFREVFMKLLLEVKNEMPPQCFRQKASPQTPTSQNTSSTT
jgi:KaiC/GvpD/RAD55 family RecA-like ATPase